MNRGVPAEIRAMVYTGHHGGAVANRPTDFSAPVAQGIEQRFPKRNGAILQVRKI